MTCSPVLFHKAPYMSRSQMEIKAESDWNYLGYGAQGHLDYTGLYATYGVQASNAIQPSLMPLNLDPQSGFDVSGYQPPPYHSDYQLYNHHNSRSDGLFPYTNYLLPSPQAPIKKEFVPCRLENDLNNLKHEKRPCDVCGDVAAGFHCKAFVCEACKKFFIRSSRAEQQGSSKYTCTKNGNCEVSKETRTHCQYCRYQKCLMLDMCPPSKNATMGEPISEIPCRVCSAPSSGYHFGAMTCEGCKGFFRRTIKERDSGKYICSKGNRCDINQQTRNACKSCRFTKCLQAGMSSEASRIGRQPNAMKHMCALEIRDIRTKRHRADTYSNPHSQPACESVPPASCLTQNNNVAQFNGNFKCSGMVEPAYSVQQLYQQPPLMSGTPNLSPTTSPHDFTEQALSASLDVQVLGNSSSSRLSVCSDSIHEDHNESESPACKNSYYDMEVTTSDELRLYTEVIFTAGSELETLKHRQSPQMSDKLMRHDIWSDYLIKHFYWMAQSVFKFANRIPGFRKFDGDICLHLLSDAFYPIVLLRLARDYNLMNTESPENNLLRLSQSEFMQVYQHFPQLCESLSEHMRLLACQMANANFDETEMALILSLRLFRLDSSISLTVNQNRLDLFKTRICQNYQKILTCLKVYQNGKYMGDQSTFDWVQQLQTVLDSLGRDFTSRLRDLRFPLTDLFQQHLANSL